MENQDELVELPEGYGLGVLYFTYQPKDLGKQDWPKLEENLPPTSYLMKIHELAHDKICYEVNFGYPLDDVTEEDILITLGLIMADVVATSPSFRKAVVLLGNNAGEIHRTVVITDLPDEKPTLH